MFPPCCTRLWLYTKPSTYKKWTPLPQGRQACKPSVSLLRTGTYILSTHPVSQAAAEPMYLSIPACIAAKLTCQVKYGLQSVVMTVWTDKGSCPADSVASVTARHTAQESKMTAAASDRMRRRGGSASGLQFQCIQSVTKRTPMRQDDQLVF